MLLVDMRMGVSMELQGVKFKTPKDPLTHVRFSYTIAKKYLVDGDAPKTHEWAKDAVRAMSLLSIKNQHLAVLEELDILLLAAESAIESKSEYDAVNYVEKIDVLLSEIDVNLGPEYHSIQILGLSRLAKILFRANHPADARVFLDRIRNCFDDEKLGGIDESARMEGLHAFAMEAALFGNYSKACGLAEESLRIGKPIFRKSRDTIFTTLAPLLKLVGECCFRLANHRHGVKLLRRYGKEIDRYDGASLPIQLFRLEVALWIASHLSELGKQSELRAIFADTVFGLGDLIRLLDYIGYARIIDATSQLYCVCQKIGKPDLAIRFVMFGEDLLGRAPKNKSLEMMYARVRHLCCKASLQMFPAWNFAGVAALNKA